MDITISQVHENTLFTLLTSLYQKYKIKNLTLSGGCAMNSVANGKILKKHPLKKYTYPQILRCRWINWICFFFTKKGQKIENNINYAYLGSNYSDEDIEQVISQKDLKKFFVKKYPTRIP